METDVRTRKWTMAQFLDYSLETIRSGDEATRRTTLDRMEKAIGRTGNLVHRGMVYWLDDDGDLVISWTDGRNRAIAEEFEIARPAAEVLVPPDTT